MIRAILPGAMRAVRSWRAPLSYLRVTGDSMAPTLRDGDWVIARRVAAARIGDIVVAHRPGDGMLLIKRVVQVTPTGYWLLGDNPAASTDSRRFGPVSGVVARLVWRVHPWGHVSCSRGRPVPNQSHLDDRISWLDPSINPSAIESSPATQDI